MAWTTPKTFTAGERLFAQDLNTYVSDNLADLDPRTVKTFADASARTSGITSPTEGMLSYLADTDAVEVYDGSAWTAVGGGKVVQVVTGTDTTDRTTSSTTFVDANISVTITPTDASSTLYLLWAANFRCYGGSSPRNINVSITDSSDVGLEGAEDVYRETSDEFRMAGVVLGRVMAGSTSAQTFKGRFRTPSARVAALTNATATGLLVAIEVAP